MELPVVTLVAIAFAGFIAQLVDGSLGMGYGVTSTSLLLSLGLAPALAAGAVVLANLSLDAARPMVSLVLLVLGAVIIFRFIHGRRTAAAREAGEAPVVDETDPNARRHGWTLIPLGLVGGFLDASGGGGW